MTTLHEINEKAKAILRSALGPVDYIRYQQQFSIGSGDYTAERQQSSDSGTATISQHVATLKAAGALVPPKNARRLKEK